MFLTVPPQLHRNASEAGLQPAAAGRRPQTPTLCVQCRAVAACSHCSHSWRPPPDAGRRAQGSEAAHGGHAHLFVFVYRTFFPHGRRGRHCWSMRPPLRRQPSDGVEDGRVAVHARAPPPPSPRTAALLACTAASRLCTACLDGVAPDALLEYPRASGLGAEHPIETPYFRPHGCEAVGQSDGTSFCGRKKKDEVKEQRSHPQSSTATAPPEMLTTLVPPLRAGGLTGAARLAGATALGTVASFDARRQRERKGGADGCGSGGRRRGGGDGAIKICGGGSAAEAGGQGLLRQKR